MKRNTKNITLYKWVIIGRESMIDSYSFGRIRINGEEYTSDVIIYPGRIQSNWWRKEGHKLQIEDMEEVLKHPPELLIVGTGAYGAMSVPEETRKHIESKGIQLVVEKTDEACKTYNDLRDKEKAVATFHLTC